MCVPIIGAAIGAAASIGGGILKAQQQQEYVDNVNKARMESFNIARIAQQREDRRQDRFDKRGWKNLNRTRKDVDATSQIEAMGAAKEKFISENPTDPAYDALSAQINDPSAGTPATVAEKAKIIGDAAARTRAGIANLGGMLSYGQVASDANRRLNVGSDILSIINNQRKGSLAVYEQEAKVADAVPQPEQPNTFMADMLTGFGGLWNRSA